MANVVLGVFADKQNAEGAISKLEARDYSPKDMSILMKNNENIEQVHPGNDAGKVVSGTAAGVGTGAVIGGLAGLLASTVLPGIGGFLIGGPVGAALGLTGAAATTVSGAATGAVAGGIIGALTSLFNLSENDAKVYEDRINEGGILVAVPSRATDEDEVKGILDQFGADNIKIVEAKGK